MLATIAGPGAPVVPEAAPLAGHALPIPYGQGDRSSGFFYDYPGRAHAILGGEARRVLNDPSYPAEQIKKWGASPVDGCGPIGYDNQGATIGDRLNTFVNAAAGDGMPVRLKTLGSKTIRPTGTEPYALWHFPLCPPGDLTAKKGSGLRNPLSASAKQTNATIKSIARFNELHTSLSKRIYEANATVLEKPSSGYRLYKSVPEHAQLGHLWKTFMTCLAYVESLRSPASLTQMNNVGDLSIYQFKPREPPTMPPCVDAWNAYTSFDSEAPDANVKASRERFSKPQEGDVVAKVLHGCLMTPDKEKLEAELRSPYQTFASYCGVNKILQSLTVQSMDDNGVAPAPGALWRNHATHDRPPACVPLFKAEYMHFGPIGNSTGGNLTTLMNCVDKSLEKDALWSAK